MLIVKTSVARILIFFFCTEPLTLPLCFNQFVAGNSQGLTLSLQLAEMTAKPSKSLHRMLSASGNPSKDNLAAIFGAARANLGVNREVHATKCAWIC